MFLKLSRFFLYASVFSIVIVSGNTFFPFIGVKYYFFRFMVELAFGAFLLWWAFDPAAQDNVLKAKFDRLRKNPLFLAVTAFAAVFLLATLFAHDPSAAFWSNFERGEGGFQMLHYYAFFALLLLAFDRREHWRNVMYCALAAGVLMILYGAGAALVTHKESVDQAGNAVITPVNPFGLIGPYIDQSMPDTYLGRIFSARRFQGSLGNPAYVAPYLLFIMFFTAWLWLNRAKQALGYNLAYGFLGALFLLFFFLSQTRGAVLGLGAGICVFLLYLFFSHRKSRLPAAIVLAVLAVIAGGLVYFRDSELIRKIPGNRLLYINLQESTAQTRFWTWNSAWQGVKERPLLGWGPENFSVVFDKYFDTRHWVPGQNTETWFDRAHSVIFDYMAETGLLGLAAYLSMFGAFLYMFFTKARQLFTGLRSALLGALLLAIPTAYLVQALVLFDVLPIYLNLFLFLAFAAWYLGSDKPHALED